MVLRILIVLALSWFVPRDLRASEQTAFFAVSIYADSGSARLAAYQVEVELDGGQVVGVEGGSHPAFADAPYYDPAALHGGRIKLAAWNTGDSLPSGRVRIATLHVRGARADSGIVKLRKSLATDSAAQAIPLKIEFVVEPREGKDS